MGTGAELDTADFSPAAAQHISRADRVLYLTRWPEVATTVYRLRPDAESLHYLQDAAASPADAVLAVAEEVLAWVRIGQQVAAVFVGPAARVAAHVTAGLALAQGLPAAMVPATPHTGWLARLSPSPFGAPR